MHIHTQEQQISDENILYFKSLPNSLVESFS